MSFDDLTADNVVTIVLICATLAIVISFIVTLMKLETARDMVVRLQSEKIHLLAAQESLLAEIEHSHSRIARMVSDKQNPESLRIRLSRHKAMARREIAKLKKIREASDRQIEALKAVIACHHEELNRPVCLDNETWDLTWRTKKVRFPRQTIRKHGDIFVIQGMSTMVPTTHVAVDCSAPDLAAAIAESSRQCEESLRAMEVDLFMKEQAKERKESDGVSACT